MRMYNPPHPGEILLELFLAPDHISISRAAKALGITRKHLSKIINGHAGITPEMALRLELAFGVSAESWLGHQAAHDLWIAGQGKKQLKVTSLRAA
jgi:addiction module HigA family antidote